MIIVNMCFILDQFPYTIDLRHNALRQGALIKRLQGLLQLLHFNSSKNNPISMLERPWKFRPPQQFLAT